MNFIVHLGRFNLLFICITLTKQNVSDITKDISNNFNEEVLNLLIPTMNKWTEEDSSITLEHLKNRQFWFEISPGDDALGSCDKNMHPDERYKNFSVNFDDNKILKNEFYYQVFEEIVEEKSIEN